jgi:hypothetical protein
MNKNGWECRITVGEKLNCIVRLPIGYIPFTGTSRKQVLKVGASTYMVTYDVGEYMYEFLLEEQAGALYPDFLSIIGEETIFYEYRDRNGVVWVPSKPKKPEMTFEEFIEHMKALGRAQGISEETLRVLDDPEQYNFFRKPMFLPEGMKVTEFLRALPTKTDYLQYLYYVGIGPMHTDKETIKSMPLMLMFLVDTARLSSVGMIASAQCTVRGEPTTVCNYYVLGAGGFRLTDKAGLEAAIKAYKEKRI